MKYLSVPREHRITIKEIAYTKDPEIWKSYSGKSKLYKIFMDHKRQESLNNVASGFQLNKSGDLIQKE